MDQYTWPLKERESEDKETKYWLPNVRSYNKHHLLPLLWLCLWPSKAQKEPEADIHIRSHTTSKIDCWHLGNSTEKPTSGLASSRNSLFKPTLFGFPQFFRVNHLLKFGWCIGLQSNSLYKRLHGFVFRKVYFCVSIPYHLVGGFNHLEKY